MRIGTLSRLWRYPVKSMAGERVPIAAIGPRGIPGDRGWAVFDETRDGVTGAKRLPILRRCGARYLSEPRDDQAAPHAEIVLPDGSRVTTSADDAARLLSDCFGRAVSLRSLGPVGSEAAPRLSTSTETPDVVRALQGLLPGEPEADMSEFPPERLSALRQGNFFDALPIHLLTSATIRTLQRRAPESNWDERRFRPNLFVETEDGAPFPELEWIGRSLRVGAARIEVVTGCPRCVMVTQPVEDVPQDHRIMRTLVRETRHTAGIYARVLEGGAARVGDAVVLES